MKDPFELISTVPTAKHLNIGEVKIDSNSGRQMQLKKVGSDTPFCSAIYIGRTGQNRIVYRDSKTQTLTSIESLIVKGKWKK